MMKYLELMISIYPYTVVDFPINIHFSIQSDAILSLGSGLKYFYYDNSDYSGSRGVAIECELYPMVILASRESSRTDVIGAFAVRPHNVLTGYYSSTYSASITWGDTSIDIGSGAGYFDYIFILGY